MALLTGDLILEAFERLNARLVAMGERADVYLVGGAVMCVVHRARPSTKDVDGWFTNPAAVRTAVSAVAEELDLPTDWLNDAAKAFVPPNAGLEAWRAWSNLTVSTVDARTLLAMKCASSRTDTDVDDIRTLASMLELRSAKAVLDVVQRYFPEDRLPVRTRLLLEEMFDDGS